MNIGKETKAYWGNKFIEILDPHKEGHIIRVYHEYWDEKAPIREQSGKPLTSEQIDEIYFDSTLDIDRQYNQLYAFARAIEAAHGIKDNNS